MIALEAVSPIGVRYTRIRNLYLFCRPLSPSEAPRSAAFLASKDENRAGAFSIPASQGKDTSCLIRE
jgi:hypothetical protein